MFSGSMVALVTPMQEDGSLDFRSLDALIDWHLASGTDAIVSVGTTGESATLDEDEHCRVIAHTIKRVAGRIPVIAGTGANSTAEAIRWTRRAAADGADACLLVTPYYNKPTQEGLYRHYRAIAEAVDIPQILYNVPGRTACDMSAETVARLADVRPIVGIKEASGTVQRVSQIRALCGDRFEIYSGDDALALDSVEAGAQGVISVTANIAPAEMHEMMQAALAGDMARAREIDAGLALLHQRLFLESNPIPVKWALQRLGRIPGGIRLPLTPLAAEYQAPLRAAMDAAGLLTAA